VSTWLFRTPTVDEGPASWEDMLFLRVKLARGITIIGDAQGGFTAVRYPTQDEINPNDAGIAVVYMGGHEYVVTDAARSALINGGVGVTAANFTLIS
jgi:hypothetical protein